MNVSDMGTDLDRVLITEDQLNERLDQIAAEINVDYAGRNPLLLGVLKGAVYVVSDLSRRLNFSAQME
ncbi:MAG: hypoxanthine phosphoribosyltransferase, partial [Actinomyces graevenitzii]|nr:hypoxanthine phosphoribosyltransferase [Actinomyces graevenitzii]